MTLRSIGFGIIAFLYVGAATLFVGFNHLPHVLDLFYGSVVLAPVAIVCGVLALDWRIAISLYVIFFTEFMLLSIAMSPPTTLPLYIIGSVVNAAINAVPQGLLYIGGRALRPKLVF